MVVLPIVISINGQGEGAAAHGRIGRIEIKKKAPVNQTYKIVSEIFLRILPSLYESLRRGHPVGILGKARRCC